MQKFKSECEILMKRDAVVLLRDGFTENGTPIYVVRKVIGLYGKKFGRGSEWGIRIDHPLRNGAERVLFKSIKGWNIDGNVFTPGLVSDMDRFAPSLKPTHIGMIVSDARARLRMAGEETGLRITDRQPRSHKIERFFSDLWRQDFSLYANNGHRLSWVQTKKTHQISDGSKRRDHQHRNSISSNPFSICLSVILADDRKVDSPRKREENLTHITMRYCDIVPCLMSRNQFDLMVKRGVIKRVRRGSKDVQGIYSVPV